MASNVIDKLLQQCRQALLGGVPIVYIKTDSPILMRDLVENRENPLVVPIGITTQDPYSRRPISQWLQDGRDIRKQVYNIKPDTVPDLRSPLFYPFLWTCRVSGPGDTSLFTAMEKYILAREDPTHHSWEMLQSSVVLLYSSEVYLPAPLRPYTEVLEVEYPEEAEIRNLVISESGADELLMKDEAKLNRLCTLFLGFSTEEIVTTMQKIVALTSFSDFDQVEKQIFARKKQKLEGGLLELVTDKGKIGGMRSFQQWLKEQIDPLTNANTYKRKLGTMPPKGVLLCGIPGCGKSEAAKFTANQLELPLLKMDVGSLMDKYQGNSEQKMRAALHLAEAMAPCVLWIDELEKGFSGAGGSDDNASFKRMFGYMLGWMQDVKVPCFIFATANSIGGLPKEFFRSGRFDALYAVYLPTREECVNIFHTSMKRAEDNIAKSKGIRADQVNLFRKDCFHSEYLEKILDSMLVRGGIPRIVIGSDIQKIVNVALRSLMDAQPIGVHAWRNALCDAIGKCTVYGDGEENVDSIAVSYCRMLRKNFVPTSNAVLFDARDYVVNNLTAYEQLLRKPTASMSEKEFADYQKKLEDCQILKKSVTPPTNTYDEAVYNYLYERINQVALPLERHEREQLIIR